jgi:hypothetical protein
MEPALSRRLLLLMGLLGFAMAWLAARPQTSPGYMDADYYYTGGLRLAQGHGFWEQVLWNYLDDPAGLPHPSHGYWGPLASLAAAAGMLLTGRLDFAGGRALFLLAAAAIPPLTACLAYALHGPSSEGRRRQALLSGLLAAFPGFYLPYLATTDSFGLTMIAGGLFLLILNATDRNTPQPIESVKSHSSQWRDLVAFAGLGVLAAAMHLARADGAVWLLAALFFIVVMRPKRPLALAACLTGYLLVYAPWMARNLAVFSAPLPPGGGRALWITQYDELYSYPASLLTPARWLQSGFGEIIRARVTALGSNLQTALAVQGQVYLAPLALAGLWQLRRKRSVQAGVLLWLITLAVMTLVFPFQGGRGGFFHSGASLQPLIWAAAPVGFESILAWGARKRGWDLPQARRFFSVGLVVLALVITAAVSIQRMVGESSDGPFWNASARRYAVVEANLQSLAAPAAAVVMVNNPPGYYAAAQRPAIAIPYGNLDALLAAAQRYQAAYLVIEIDQVQGEQLFARPGDRPGLRYLGSAAEARLYAILSP